MNACSLDGVAVCVPRRMCLSALLLGSMLGVLGCAARRPPTTAAARPPAVAAPVPNVRRSEETVAPPPAQAVALHALGLVGTPYRFGGNTPEGGFDCSGLIGYVYFHAAGLRAPRSVRQIVAWGHPVTQTALQTGDLLVFGAKGQQPDHAAIYVGDGRFVHAPSTGGMVRLERLEARYWATRWLETRRVVV